MDKKQIQIKYENGEMIINLNEFFPSTQQGFKKLIKVIDLDWEHRDELNQSMLNWMIARKEEYKEWIECLENKYEDTEQSIKEAEVNIEILKVLKDKSNNLKLLKKELKELKQTRTYYQQGIYSYTNDKKKIQKNIEALENLIKK